MQLNEKKCRIAIEKSLENANSLFVDAQILEDKRRIFRAYTLYLFVIEELSKCMRCISILIFKEYKNEEAVKELKRLFRDHVFKIEKSTGIDVITYEILQKEKPKAAKKYIEASFKIHEVAKSLDKLKNQSLYTSYIKNTFKNPDEFITTKHVELIKFFAEIRLQICKIMWNGIKERYEEIRGLNLNISQINEEEILEDFIKKLRY